eukprot:311044-Prymnesium_polylepis.1
MVMRGFPLRNTMFMGSAHIGHTGGRAHPDRTYPCFLSFAAIFAKASGALSAYRRAAARAPHSAPAAGP